MQEVNWIQILVFYFIVIVIMQLIAFVESRTRPKQLFHDKQKTLITYAILIFIGVIFIIYFFKFSLELNLFDGIEIVFFLIFIKVMISIFIANQAKKLGRNKVLWGFLSFVEFHIALLVLGMNHKLVNASGQSKSEIKALNNNSLNKISAIKRSYTKGIINVESKEEKIIDVQKHYTAQFEELLSKFSVKKTNEELDRALEQGVITQEEYNSKKLEMD
ncbi:MAG: hypothetical protein RIA69_14830 [Cyclobacteriaceae bacterium]